MKCETWNEENVFVFFGPRVKYNVVFVGQKHLLRTSFKVSIVSIVDSFQGTLTWMHGSCITHEHMLLLREHSFRTSESFSKTEGSRCETSESMLSCEGLASVKQSSAEALKCWSDLKFSTIPHTVIASSGMRKLECVRVEKWIKTHLLIRFLLMVSKALQWKHVTSAQISRS